MAALAAFVLSRPVVNFLLLPALGAAHGWATNTLAVWLLFRPVRPWRVPILGVRVQGVLPRRQADLARSVGRAVENELLSWRDLAATLAGPEVLAHLASRVDMLIRERVLAVLPAWIPGGWRDGLAQAAAGALGDGAADAIEGFLAQAADEAARRLPIASLVEARVAAFAPEEFERLVRRTAAAELRGIVLLGLGMGALIGLAQGAFLTLIGQ